MSSPTEIRALPALPNSLAIDLDNITKTVNGLALQVASVASAASAAAAAIAGLTGFTGVATVRNAAGDGTSSFTILNGLITQFTP